MRILIQGRAHENREVSAMVILQADGPLCTTAKRVHDPGAPPSSEEKRERFALAPEPQELPPIPASGCENSRRFVPGTRTVEPSTTGSRKPQAIQLSANETCAAHEHF